MLLVQDRASAAQLDSILGRSGMGSDVLEELRKVPCYAVQMNVVENDHAKSFIKVEVVVMVRLRLMNPHAYGTLVPAKQRKETS